MLTRYITGTLFVILGGFVVVVSQAFPAVLGRVAFGVAIGVIVISGLAQLDRSMRCPAFAVAVVGLALTGLTLHEAANCQPSSGWPACTGCASRNRGPTRNTTRPHE
jgi:hypothetical protein